MTRQKLQQQLNEQEHSSSSSKLLLICTNVQSSPRTGKILWAFHSYHVLHHCTYPSRPKFGCVVRTEFLYDLMLGHELILQSLGVSQGSNWSYNTHWLHDWPMITHNIITTQFLIAQTPCMYSSFTVEIHTSKHKIYYVKHLSNSSKF